MPDIVVVKDPNLPITISDTDLPVTVASPGPQGPTGPEGPPGAPGGSVYEHTQSSPSSNWVINHNIGVEPDVNVIVSGEEVYPDIIHGSVNQTTLVFGSAAAGKARLRP